MRRERPRSRTAEQGDELAPSHSITSSARRRKDSGIFSPIALAVVRLMTSSNLVGCKTGRSAGFFALEDAAYIEAGLPKTVRLIGTITYQKAGSDGLARITHRG